MMTPEQQNLYERLMAFDFDAGAQEDSFAHRVAMENNWSIDFAQRVVEEYRNFVFLMACADHPCTPSKVVDRVWHMHLAYTRSYWDRMCAEIIGRPLHHDPGSGSAGESEKFVDWYVRTLDSYSALLGTRPPADIWPDPRDADADVDHRKSDTTVGYAAACAGGADQPPRTSGIDTGTSDAASCSGGASCGGGGCGGGCGGG